MNSSAQSHSMPPMREYDSRRKSPSTARRVLQMPVLAAVCISPLFLWPLFLPSDESVTQASKDELARACANWETVALDALAKRLNGARAGRDTFARSADQWLADARRNCAEGSSSRAARNYHRIITTAKAELSD